MKSSKAQTHAKFHRIPAIRFEDQQLTSFSGLVIFQMLFRRIGLKQRLKSCFSHLKVSPIFGHHLVTMLLVVHLLLGYRRLREADYYRDDPLVLRLMGLRRIPNVSTVSRTLSGVDQQGIENVRNLSKTLVIEGLQRENFPRLTLDFDGSVQSTKGHAEGTAVGFNKAKKGARSYYPLFCTVAQTAQFFDVHHRPGNVHDSNGAVEFMTDCFEAVKSQLPGILLESRMDSAFFNQDTLTMLSRQGVKFTASVPFERFPQLKGLVESRKRWNRIDKQWSYFEADWKPKSWNQSFRFIVTRKRNKTQRKGPLQLQLFEPVDFNYDYKVIVTNKRESTKSVILFHNGRGSQEAIFGDAKNDAGLDMIPCRRLAANQIFTLSAMMAHNLSREIQMLSKPSTSRALPKRPAAWKFEKLDTLRHRIIQRAGRISRPRVSWVSWGRAVASNRHYVGLVVNMPMKSS